MLAVLSLPLTPFFSFLSFLHAVNGAAEGHQWRPSRSQETVELASRHNIDSKVLNRQLGTLLGVRAGFKAIQESWHGVVSGDPIRIQGCTSTRFEAIQKSWHWVVSGDLIRIQGCISTRFEAIQESWHGAISKDFSRIQRCTRN